MLKSGVDKRPLNLAFLVDFHDHNMGYMSNFLPEEISKLNFNVTILVPMNSLQLFERNESSSKRIENFIEYKVVHLSDKFRLIGLDTFNTSIGLGFKNFKKLLKKEKFDIIQSFVISPGFLNLQLLFFKKKYGFKICLQDHSSESVFFPNIKGKIFLFIFRKFISPYFNSNVEKIFIPSPDIKQIVIDNYGLRSELIEYEPLAVNSNWFRYPTKAERLKAKSDLSQFDVPASALIILYAGKLSHKKGADFLAQTIGEIHKEHSNIFGIFVGSGTPEEVKIIKSFPGCKVVQKQRASQLNKFYWAADLSVWPREGSTSILDSMASGVPTIVRSGLTEIERRPFAELIFEENNQDSLKSVILKNLFVYKSFDFGKKSSDLILNNHTWKLRAQKRATIYEQIASV